MLVVAFGGLPSAAQATAGFSHMTGVSHHGGRQCESSRQDDMVSCGPLLSPSQHSSALWLVLRVKVTKGRGHFTHEHGFCS
jgi:hypothetical protein